MCLAIPYKIIDINNGWANLGKNRKANIALVPKAKKGDWLLIHADLAVNILSENEAQEVLQLVKACPHDHHY